MPSGAAEARARQLATLRREAHLRFTDGRIGMLLRTAATEVEGLDPLSFEASLVRVAMRDHEKALRLSPDLVAAIAESTGRARNAWRTARKEDDFDSFVPYLERVLELTIQKAEALGGGDCLYDALLDEFEPGMTTNVVHRVFSELRAELVPLVQVIAERPEPDDSFLCQPFDGRAQWDFGMEVLREVGYDFDRGRQDVSAHPFSTSFSITDVRITTRIDEDHLPSGLFSTLHEAGHALYEQGIDAGFEGTLLADGTSLGMHESQSRLWENQVGRSRAFWKNWYAKLQRTFPDQLQDVEREAFYRAINKVSPSLIRVEADEVTYNLHVMLRFELERALVDGGLRVRDLPAAWNAGMEEYLGLQPESNADGVLQDIHWSLGAIGYFPTYTLGTLMSAQLYECALEALSNLEEQIVAGEFQELLMWLRAHVHRHGRTMSASDILRNATGSFITASPWLRYVRQKYSEIYGPLR